MTALVVPLYFDVVDTELDKGEEDISELNEVVLSVPECPQPGEFGHTSLSLKMAGPLNTMVFLKQPSVPWNM